MRRALAPLLVAAALFACGDVRSAAVPARVTRTVPLPIPERHDPVGIGPDEPSAPIAAFLRSLDPKDGLPKVTIASDGRSVVLSPADASRVLIHLSSPFAYADSHPMCTDEGYRITIEAKCGTLDLLIGTLCRHVYLAGSSEELAFLSEGGQAFFTTLHDDQLSATRRR